MLMTYFRPTAHWTRGLLLGLLVVALCSPALWGQVTVTVVGSDGSGGIPFRYLVEEDTTRDVVPGVVYPNPPSLNFHKSSFPVVTKGESLTGDPVVLSSIDLPAGKKYFVSVMPKTLHTYAMSGMPIAKSPRPLNVTVTLNKLPLPTAQISIFVFEDTLPLDNAPGLTERGLAGFDVQLEDAGGRYGAAAGTLFWDAFGNPLGTTYQTCTIPTPTCVNGYVLDAPGGGPIVLVQGTGVVKTDATGRALIKNLAPAKYGVTIIPPRNQDWHQTSTIEGTKIVDAWVASNEPPFFKEFGPASYHAFFGFVRSFNDLGTLAGKPRVTINGRVTVMRTGPPPSLGFYSGPPFAYTTAWIGLNDTAAGKALMVKRGNEDGTFSIPNVPPGTYQLVVFDDNMDIIVNFSTVSVDANGNCNGLVGCNIGDVPVNPWFTRQIHRVFIDDGCAGQPGVTAAQTAAWAENGYREPCEKPAGAGYNVNLRWRDGTINQFAATDLNGERQFSEIFPFFNWQVAEVDYGRLKATGATLTVDTNGPINPSGPRTFGGQLDPQPQVCKADDVVPGSGNPACEGKAVGSVATNPFSAVEPGGLNNLSRTQQGPWITEAYQGFIGATSVFEWGKAPYPPGENGGISGVVYYATMRAEDKPDNKAQLPYEPGIPDVMLNLWTTTKDAEGNTVAYQKVATTASDSWDTKKPTGCQGDNYVFHYSSTGQTVTDCFDGFRNGDQVRNGTYDGAYAFTSCEAMTDGTGTHCVPPGSGGTPIENLPVGEYIVEVVPPIGYQVPRAHDKNLDYGEDFIPPAPAIPPPACVGPTYTVEQYLQLFPDEQIPTRNPGTTLNECNMKLVAVNPGQNAASDFFLFTEVPIAARVTGMLTDDLANTRSMAAPNYGEKFAPAWVPIAIRDYQDREILRTYGDQFGTYGFLLPATFNTNIPNPSGLGPSMLQACINARMMPNGQQDPFFRENYAETCYVMQFVAGATTYLDTPMFPIAAFSGRNELPPDCEQRDGTPRIAKVTAPANGRGGGPWVPAGGGTVEIYSMGTLSVKNPDYCPGPPLSPDCNPINTNLTVSRDYGFGTTQGKVYLGSTALPDASVSWSNSMITVTLPAGATTGELTVQRADTAGGLRSINGVTLTIGGDPAKVRAVTPLLPGQTCGGGVTCPIQAAIDAAANGDLILVADGRYREEVIMYKPVQLQGWGEATVIDALAYPGTKITDWRNKAGAVLASGAAQLLPGQTAPQNQPLGVGPLNNEEGAGILVLSKPNLFTQALKPRIDGFTITGSESGGIVVNGYAPYLEISNNRIAGNSGIWGGGVRIGSPFLINGATYTDAQNDNIKVHHNHILLNGGQNGAGGGVSICTGADNYEVTDNFVCGNLNLNDGGGIGHLGKSDKGLIARNRVLFNESWNNGITVNGGGISIGGLPPLAPATLTPGAGSVKVNANLMQGNSAGAGDGAGIAVGQFNGQDVATNLNDPTKWHALEIYNNIVANNVAGVAGGGISLADVVNSKLIHNTIVHNDSTATAIPAFPAGWGLCTGGCVQDTIPQPAGLVSRALSLALLGLRNWPKDFANPDLYNNIIWQNRSFYFHSDSTQDPPVHLLLPDLATPGTQPVYWDLGVLGSAQGNGGKLAPNYSLLTSTQGYGPSNIAGDPRFILQYVNGGGNGTNPAQDPLIAFDEGGNAIKVRYGPLSETIYNAAIDLLRGDYHIGANSAALNQANNGQVSGDLTKDYDGEPRPAPIGPAGQQRADMGADERQQ